MWRKEYRIVYYSWEFDTLQSFYRDLLRLPQMYGWYTSPVDRGCKFKIGDNRLELICRHPTLPQGPAGMRLEAKDIELCYANLKRSLGSPLSAPCSLIRGANTASASRTPWATGWRSTSAPSSIGLWGR